MRMPHIECLATCPTWTILAFRIPKKRHPGQRCPFGAVSTEIDTGTSKLPKNNGPHSASTLYFGTFGLILGTVGSAGPNNSSLR